MDYNKAELEILEALDAGELSKDEAKGLLSDLGDKQAPVVDEMHPDIAFTSRLLYKNLATDPEAGFNFLQKKHPELKFKKDASGDVLAKRQDEKEWRRLDPTGFDLQDITDVGYDVVSGIGEGAAAVAGGLAGGAAGLPAGPGAVATGLGGAAAAGGAAGAGFEALRNQLGQFAGMDQEQNLGDIGSAAAFGAVSPLLLGTGAAGKQIAKQAVKSGVKGSALAKTQRGILGQAKDKLAPWVGEKVTGIESRFLKRAAKDMDTMIDAAKDYDAVYALEDIRERILKGHDQKMRDVGSNLGKIIDESDGSVSLGNVKKEFTDLIARYQKKVERLGTKNAMDDLEFVTSAYDQYIPKKNTLAGEDAVTLKQDLNEITRIKKTNAAGFDTQQYKIGSAEKDLARIAKKATSKLDESITNSIDGGVELKAANQQYSQLINDKGVLQKYFKDAKSTENTLRKSLGGKDAKHINSQLRKTGVDVEDMAEGLVARDIFSSPSSKILPLGSSPTARGAGLRGSAAGLLALGGGAVGGPVGAAVGAATGGLFGEFAGSPSALKAYMKANQIAGRGIKGVQNLPIVPYAPNIQGTVNILDNLQRGE